MMGPEEVICPYCYGGAFDNITIYEPNVITVRCVNCDSVFDIHSSDGDVIITEIEEGSY